MKYEQIIELLRAKHLVIKRAIVRAENVSIAEVELYEDKIIGRVETSNRMNTFALLPETGGFHCSCMKSRSKRVCKDILAYLKTLSRVRDKRVLNETMKWLNELAKR